MWLRQVAIAVGYAAAVALLREISFSHWVVFAGFRLCVLLLVPYRYWPALAVGELGPLAWVSFTCMDELGGLWSLLMLFPPVLLAMPLVYWCRERLKLFTAHATVNIGVFLLCALMVSTLWTAMNLGAFAVARVPDGYVRLYTVWAGRWFLGNYLGVLTIVPVVLLAREVFATTPWRRLWYRLAGSAMCQDSISMLLPCFLLLIWLSLRWTGEMQQVARMLMFLPVVGMSLRYGWRGAAIGGTAASIAVVLIMPSKYDQATLQGQVFIAFAMTTMLLLGARIAILNQRETIERSYARGTLTLAQRNVRISEQQLQQTSYAVEQIRQVVQSTYGQMMGRLRHLLPTVDERDYHRQVAAAQEQMYRLADSLYPQVWRERGLSGALREGAMARMLGEAGITYWCDFRGSSLSRLSPTVNIALYRLACESIACQCSRRDVSELHVRLRGIVFHGRRGALLCIDGRGSPERLRGVRWEELQPRLARTTGGMDVGAIQDRAAVFEGKARFRSHAAGSRISIVLYDPE